MSTNDYILNVLDIKDKNIKIKLQNFYIVTNFLKYDINILITEGENNLIKVNQVIFQLRYQINVFQHYLSKSLLSSYFLAIFFAFFILYIWASAFSIKSSTEVWVSLRNE